MKWILDNKEWVFSGVGLFILGAIGSFIRYLYSKKSNSTRVMQNQKSGKNSINVQVAGDLRLKSRKDETRD